MTEWTVTPNDNGIRPAGKPDECFYCHQKLGQRHKRDCVVPQQTVKVRLVLVFERSVPACWTKDDIDFDMNESSSCKDNLLDEIKEYIKKFRGCACPIGSAEVIENGK